MTHLGRRYLLTGAAGAIGSSIAHRLAAEGALLTVVDRESAALRVVAGEANGATARICDLSEPDVAEDLVAWSEEVVGPLDGLIHCAAAGEQVELLDCSWALWEQILRVNLTATFALSLAAARRMADRKSGVILLFASGAGIRPNAGNVPYGAAKAGILGLARAMAVDLAHDGVRVNAVVPGPTDSPLLHGIAGDAVEQLKERIMLGRLARPDEIASVVDFLLTPAASYVTGAVVSVDGGFTTSGSDFRRGTR